MRTCWRKRIISVKQFRNGGFTFVEMILSFSLFLSIIAFVPLSLQMILGEGLLEEDLQRMEWEVFVSQAKKEIRMSDKLLQTGNILLFEKNGQLIKYERYGANMRRTVDGKGHELILLNVKAMTFEPVVQGVKISVVDGFDQSHTALIRILIEGNSQDGS